LEIFDYYEFMPNLNIFLGADHRGVKLKSQCISWLKQHDYNPVDLGTNSEERCDAFDFAKKMDEQFKADSNQFGILICGTGQAMAMTANRYRNIRAALCTTPEVAKLSREHNDANVLVMGADTIDADTALKCVEVFLGTKFLGGRYAERRDKLTDLGGL
jgi:ribose 5-phosphate isomerase B